MSKNATLRLISKGDGRPIVLLHGWGCNESYWERLIPRLEARGYQVWIARAPGYSEDSETLPIPEKYFSVAAHRLADEIRNLAQQPIDVLAHSMGVYTACVLAASHPQALNSLTMVSIVPDPPPQKASNPAVNEILKTGSLSYETADNCIRKWYDDATLCGVKHRLLVADLCKVPAETLIASAQACTIGLSKNTLDRVKTNTHVIVGTRDTARSPSDIQAYAQLRSERKLSLIEGAGHMPHWSHPDIFTETVHSYITQKVPLHD